MLYYNRHQQLATWIDNLVEILRLQNSSTWQTLVLTVAGKTAIIELDQIILKLSASDGEPLVINIEYPVTSHHLNFSSDSQTFKDIIAGYMTIDQAIALGKIYIRGELKDLLGMQKLIMEIIADSPVNRKLQNLWNDFDQLWNPSFSANSYYALEQQLTTYGQLILHIPEDVLLIGENQA